MAQSTTVEYRGVMVIGKAGAGKSTVANAIVHRDDYFKVSGSASSFTGRCEHCFFEVSERGTFYRIKVLDTAGLFDTDPTTNNQTIAKLKTYVRDHFMDGINLIIFVREGRFTPEEKKSFDMIRSEFGEDISVMSALVITNYDLKDEKTRSEVIENFRSSPLTKPIAEFMKAGIYAVGLPPKSEYSNLPPSVKSYYEECIAKDREMLFKLVKRSSEGSVTLKLFQAPNSELCVLQ